MTHQPVPKISLDELRLEIKKEYTNVALDPNKGYHFHTGRRLANLLGYDEYTTAEIHWEFSVARNRGREEVEGMVTLRARKSKYSEARR